MEQESKTTEMQAASASQDKAGSLRGENPRPVPISQTTNLYEKDLTKKQTSGDTIVIDEAITEENGWKKIMPETTPERQQIEKFLNWYRKWPTSAVYMERNDVVTSEIELDNLMTETKELFHV